MNKIAKSIISIIVGALIIYLLFKNLGGTSNLKEVDISAKSFLIALSFFLIIKLINTVRYSFIYSVNPSIKVFSILTWSNMMLSILPFRAGEAFYVTNFKKHFNIDAKKGSSNLLLIRLADYLVVYILVLIASLYVSTKVKGNLIGIISIAFFISLIIIYFISIFILRKDVSKIKYSKVSKIFSVLKEVLKSHNKNKKEFILLTLISSLYWIARLVMGYLLLTSIGINLPFSIVVFFSLITLLIGLLPIKTFGDFGLFEGGWTLLLASVGFKPEDILSKLLSYHLILFIVPIIYGIIGFLILRSNRNKNF
jgi:uncharacterized protein (TIRG00374 family)